MKNPIDNTDWKNIVENVLKKAVTLGASAAEMSASIETGFTVNVRLGEVETLEHHRDKGVGLTVYVGKRKGSASSTDTSPEALETTLKTAYEIAKVTQEDECAGLPEKELLAYDYPNLDLFHPWDIQPEQAIQIVKECEAQAMAIDKRIVNSDGCELSSHQSFYVYGNTLGFVGAYPSSQHSLSCVLVGEAKGEMQRDYGYTVARAPHDLEKISVVAEEAARRTIERLGARRVKSCQVPVIFEASIARGLLGSFISAIRGSNLYRNASFLVNHLDKQIFPSHVHIFEKPHLLRGLGSAPFDSEGVITSPHDFISEGVLRSYVLSTYSARKLGMKTTGNSGGVFNLFIHTSDKDLKGLIREMGRGLLVTEVMGQGVNIVTGDYSRGVSGFWIENGEIQHPVNEVTVAGNLQDMFMQLVAVGKDVDHRGGIQTGSILIERMSVGGE